MLFSIITVSLNAGNLMKETIDSVLQQTFTDYEIIIKDGGSTDDTLSYVPQDSRIRLIQKADTGIYNAMNQGIIEARGRYLLFLNCGDKLYNEHVLENVSKIVEYEKNSIIYGNRYTKELGVVLYPKKLKKLHFHDSTICHQASFIAREAFEIVGLYDESNKVVSDWEFFLDAFIKGIDFVYVNEILCEFLAGGLSETAKGLEIIRQERAKIIKTRFTIFERLVHRIISLKSVQKMIVFIHRFK